MSDTTDNVGKPRTRKIVGESISLSFDETCPKCGWTVVSRNGLKVFDCEACGQNLVHFGTPTPITSTVRENPDGSLTISLDE